VRRPPLSSRPTSVAQSLTFLTPTARARFDILLLLLVLHLALVLLVHLVLYFSFNSSACMYVRLLRLWCKALLAWLEAPAPALV